MRKFIIFKNRIIDREMVEGLIIHYHDKDKDGNIEEVKVSVYLQDNKPSFTTVFTKEEIYIFIDSIISLLEPNRDLKSWDYAAAMKKVINMIENSPAKKQE